MFTKELKDCEVIYTASEGKITRIRFTWEYGLYTLRINGNFIGETTLLQLNEGVLGDIAVDNSDITVSCKTIKKEKFAKLIDELSRLNPEFNTIKDELQALIVEKIGSKRESKEIAPVVASQSFSVARTMSLFKPDILPTITDNFTDPNQRNTAQDDYFYQEKSIIDLLLKPDNSLEEYHKLMLLVAMELPASSCIAQPVWITVQQYKTYEEFMVNKATVQASLSAYLQGLETHAAETYKTTEGKLVPILQKDFDGLDPLLQLLIRKETGSKPYFTLDDIATIEEILQKRMAELKHAHSKEQWYGKRPEEQDEPAGYSTVWDSKGYESYKRYKKCFDDGLLKLRQCLIKMRFLSEFNEPKKLLKLERTLQDKIKPMSVRILGMDLLKLSFNELSAAQIQQMLNQLLLKERDPIRAQNLVEKGAQIDIISQTTGMTALGQSVSSCIYYGEPTPSPSLAAKLLDLGANVDLGQDKDGNTTLMISLKNSMPLSIVERIFSQSNRCLERNKKNQTALMFAINAAKKEPGLIATIIQPLIETPDSYSDAVPLMTAVSASQTEVVRLLLSRPEKYLEVTDEKGLTPLANACAYSMVKDEVLDIIDQLIQAGSDVTVKGRFKRPIMESSAPIVRAQIEKSLAKLRPVHVAHHDGTDEQQPYYSFQVS